MWRCPTCKSTEYLDVRMDVWARLVQGGEDNFETDTDLTGESQGHEWNANHSMVCNNQECADTGKGGKTAGDFEWTPEYCTACNRELDPTDGDNWGDLCPGCADKVSAYMDATDTGRDAAIGFIEANPDWSDEDSEG